MFFPPPLSMIDPATAQNLIRVRSELKVSKELFYIKRLESGDDWARYAKARNALELFDTEHPQVKRAR